MQRIFLAALLLTAVGCAAPAPRTIDVSAMSVDTLMIVHAPTERALYVEITDGKRRLPDIDYSVTMRSASMMIGGATGFASSASAAGLSLESAAVANPYSAAFAILALPTIDAASRLGERVRTERIAEPFLELLDERPVNDDLRAELHDVLERRLSERVELLDDLVVDPDTRVNSDWLAQRHADLVLVMTQIYAFTPQTEALQLIAVYALFGEENGFEEPLHTNTTVVQSQLHGAPPGRDTFGDLDAVADDWLEEQYALIDRSSVSRTRKRAHRLHAAMESDRYRKPSFYRRVDNHDAQGMLWLENDGEPFLTWIRLLQEETARLMAIDLAGGIPPGVMPEVEAPGYDRQLERLRTADAPGWSVFRMGGGALISVPATAPMIPLSEG